MNIRINADINYVKYKKSNTEKKVSFQEFLLDEIGNCEELNFCIDISNVRTDKRENLDNWLVNFLKGDVNKKTKGSKENGMGILTRNFNNIEAVFDLFQEMRDNKNAVIGLQKIVSPISDKEVIMSFRSKITEYKLHDEINYDDIDEISFELSKENLGYLLYAYYLKFCDEKGSPGFDKRFQNLLNKATELISKEENKQYEELGFIVKGIEDWINCPNAETVQKTDAILSFVNWSNETLDVKKNIESIYKMPETDNSINIMKQFLQIAAR